MQTFVKLCGVAIAGCGAAMALRKNSGVFALLLSAAMCIAAGFFIVSLLQPVLSFIEQLQTLSGLSDTLLDPLLKTVAVGFLTRITSSVCRDTGQSAAADSVELGGSILALYLALPIFNTVLSLLRELMGG